MDELKNDSGEPLRKCSMCKSVKLLEGNFEKNTKDNLMKTCNTCRNKHKCSYENCEFKTHENAKLTRHINTVHLKLTPFECTEENCGAKFGTKGELTVHINTVHLKLTPHQCAECDYKFGTKGRLTAHINQVHLKLTPFECAEENCDYKFGLKTNLVRHINTVHLKLTPFECSNCGHKFGANSHLTKHIKICTGKEHISSGEYAVRNALIDMNIEFEHNTPFEVKDILLLRWDFICLLDTHDTRLFIEYDGRQHFEPVTFGGISQEKAEQKLATSQHRDKIKDDFCKDNNYPLLRIKYDQFGDIPKLLTEFFVRYGWGNESIESE